MLRSSVGHRALAHTSWCVHRQPGLRALTPTLCALVGQHALAHTHAVCFDKALCHHTYRVNI